ncbi:B3 domain-containing protein [Senna tora]|uniref:B3 domain-containing protein n=1 Tax=Senna tora TaxID=362788 RepID=A0A834W1Y8_9FABA|nr:B3 domain-containing protein [Senna tora]
MMSRRKYTKPAEASRRWKRSISNLWSGSGSGSEGGGGVSTALKLYEDPWTIKKTLTESDLGRSSRLLLATDVVKSEILPMLGVDDARAAESEEGAAVRVWDLDSKSMHHLLLKRWSSSKSYVFIGKWNHDFVRRRNLHKGDLIAFHWDPSHSLFNFCGVVYGRREGLIKYSSQHLSLL